MRSVNEPARETKIMIDADVCVIGGSCTGVFAAVRAAQSGMRTVIVEKQNCFGGAASNGLVHIWHSLRDTEEKRQIIGGLTQDMIQRLQARGAVIYDVENPSAAYRMNTEELKIELDDLVLSNGVTPLLHTFFCTAICRDEQVDCIIVENKDGRGAIRAKFFIDASGDADLCRSIGLAAYRHNTVQPPTMCARICGTGDRREEIGELIKLHGAEYGLEKDWGWRDRIPGIPNTLMHAEKHVFGRDMANAADLTVSEMEGRRQVRAVMDVLRTYMPGGEEISLLSLPSYIGIRESWHIQSLYQVTEDDLLYGKRYPDSIGNGSYRVDIHHNDDTGVTIKYLDGRQLTLNDTEIWSRWREESETYPTFYQIPYQSLIPQGRIRNVLCAGRMIDADIGAFSALRVMVNTNQMGEAAGAAAALAVREGVSAAQVDAEQLRKALETFGAVVI